MKPELERLLNAGIIDKNYKLIDKNLIRIEDVPENTKVPPEADTPHEKGKVIHTDTRMLVPSPGLYPYFPIVRLLIFDGTHYSRATGFLIGANKVVTAGHCVYHNGAFSVDIVAVAEPGTSQNHYGVCTGYRYDPNYVANPTSENDWAVLRLDAALGAYAGVLPIADYISLPTQVYMGEIAGYPGIAQARSTKNMWTATGIVTSYATKPLLSYTISTSGGDSGAPVLIQDAGNYCVCGIHVAGTANTNLARMIDANLLQTLIQY